MLLDRLSVAFMQRNQLQSEFQMNGIRYALTPNPHTQTHAIHIIGLHHNDML